MVRRHLFTRMLWSAALAALVSFAGATRAHAQPPPDDPNDNKPPQMCGTVSAAHPNGETFTVHLPDRDGATTGPKPLWQDIDDKQGALWEVAAEDVVPGDSITLPKGCRIYAFLISGWGDNKNHDQIIFYKLAEWVAQRNGYVHVGWWNNLTAPYMERPLHESDITLTERFLGNPEAFGPTPGTRKNMLTETDVDNPKANPDEDFQFVADLRKTLKAVRDNNPDAYIIVAAHSMGADAVLHALSGQTLINTQTTTFIDLLAVIDPVGNRDRPFKPFTSSRYQWTRWRATHTFRGWRKLDCERRNDGSCKPYGFLGLNVNCVASGGWLNYTTGPFDGGHFLCPGYVEDSGPAVKIGGNIRHLYYRFQHEEATFLGIPFLFDYQRSDFFDRPGSPRVEDILSPNSQASFPTCSNLVNYDYDPLDNRYLCERDDGHGELVGYRKKSELNHEIEGVDEFGRAAPGLKVRWPQDVSSEGRRARLIELASLSPEEPNSTESNTAWLHRPINPDLCLVCDDLIAIANHQLTFSEEEDDTTAPTSYAEANPDANEQGWYNQDVVVSVTATDSGSGVESIDVALNGEAATTTAGDSAQTTVTAEGLTTISFFARDVDGNTEAAKTLDVRVDKTPPDVNVLTNPQPNAQGWFANPVVVSFTVSDTGGSGVANTPEPVSANTEGAAQEIVGMAEDIAGNITSALVTLNIDLTPPQLAAITDVSPNAHGWNNTDVRVSFDATDTLSGIASSTPETVVSTEGANQPIAGTATDRAGHSASASVTLNIDKTAPQITATANIAPNSHGWNSGDVVVSFTASDALSGLTSSPPDVTASSEGAAQNISATVEDRAGNSASASLAVSIDKTAPAIALSSRTPANGAGWNNTDVAVTWNCSDALSGPLAAQVSQSLAAEGAGQNAVGTCEDRAGHTAADTQSGINIDKTAPSNQIATPTQGAVYELNAQIVSSYQCADALSGVTSCAGPVASGSALDTTTVGPKIFTVSSSDAAGNPDVASHTYAVRYGFSGFSNPIAGLPALNNVNAGRTVPVKYSLRDANGIVISDPTSFTSLVSIPVACGTNAPAADAVETDGAGSTTIGFDSGQFIFNWKTDSAWAGSCRILQLTLNDGTQHTVAFKFK